MNGGYAQSRVPLVAINVIEGVFAARSSASFCGRSSSRRCLIRSSIRFVSGVAPMAQLVRRLLRLVCLPVPLVCRLLQDLFHTFRLFYSMPLLFEDVGLFLWLSVAPGDQGEDYHQDPQATHRVPL